MVGTFTAGINLHERVQDKRKAAKQKKLDESQTDRIDNLQKEVKRLQGRESSHGDSSSSRSSSPGRRRSRRGGSDDEEDFVRSTKRSRDMIEDQYDDYVSRVGSRYARGDGEKRTHNKHFPVVNRKSLTSRIAAVITENKLQAQIITLQQTVINVLQDALLNDRTLSQYDIQKLVTAQQSARAGTLEALKDQYSRMRLDNGSVDSRNSSRLLLEGAAGGPVQRQRTLPAPQQQQDDFAPARRVQSMPLGANDPLFCRYSEDLQLDSRRPLAASFSGNGNCRCPACGVGLDVDNTRVWTVATRDGSRDFVLNARFMIKSHLEDGRFACMICDRTSNSICTCRTVKGLIEHISYEHGIEALQSDVDCERR